jgi:hypothetical protein
MRLHYSEAAGIVAEVVKHDLEGHDFALCDGAKVDLTGGTLERNRLVAALALLDCALLTDSQSVHFASHTFFKLQFFIIWF